MKNVRTILLIFLSLLVGAGGTVLYLKNTIERLPEPAFHEHADFALFLNGTQFDFTKAEYMSTTPCKVSFQPRLIPVAWAHDGGDTLKDDVHLHDGIGGVVHSHNPEIVWRDFFQSLGMTFTDERFVDDEGTVYENSDQSSFRFFVNGEEVSTIAEMKIRDLDHVLISYGPRNRVKEDFYPELAIITNDACYYSENCPSRGIAPYESCGGGESKKPFLLKYLGIL